MSQQPILDIPSHETGFKPDEPDSRDFLFSSLIANGGVSRTPPTEAYDTILFKPDALDQLTLDLKDLSANSPGVYDQGDSMQSCVANSVAMAACYAWHKNPGEEQDRIAGTGHTLFNPSRWWVSLQSTTNVFQF